IGPYARGESPGIQVQVPRPPATSSTSIQLCPAVNRAPTRSPHLLENCGHVEALRTRLKAPATPQHDVNSLPLPMKPSPTGSECSTTSVASRVIHYSATAEHEPADGFTPGVPPAPVIAPYDEQTSDKHALPISRRLMPTSKYNVAAQTGTFTTVLVQCLRHDPIQ
ncbi:hypothetical protein LTR54_018068, partial [Friedmanniomyces endolithicus]